ncbi:hypothetical protein ACQJBY_032485 [Aegilops geniculata]
MRFVFEGIQPMGVIRVEAIGIRVFGSPVTREADRQSKQILWDLKKVINLQFLESFMVDDVWHSPMAINEAGDCCFTLVLRYCTKLR